MATCNYISPYTLQSQHQTEGLWGLTSKFGNVIVTCSPLPTSSSPSHVVSIEAGLKSSVHTNQCTNLLVASEYLRFTVDIEKNHPFKLFTFCCTAAKIEETQKITRVSTQRSL